ncbi:MAG: ArsR family transcriptional regulator [Candidatus Bathyarchaeota archaeon]|nr:ArsR family transcriptional regulator [Candidatus Bathyarchaeota archaeon]
MFEGRQALSGLPHRARGVKVLKAVSSPLRLHILNLLFDKSALSYTELMNALKMNPTRDAGKFAYHLKFLLKADLVEADAEAKKYYLTELGKMVLDVADKVEKKAVKPRGMLVRTSHFTLEEFDANKIANSLIREAKVPPEIAQKAAKEAEKRLFKSKIKYLTAPLVREVVNAILIEKGFEDYRHKLTRLGMPVYEVSALLDMKDAAGGSSAMLLRAGDAVFKEYTLLNVFPRDVADAHVAGAIHVNDIGTWILKPNEVMHDLRFFFQHGLKIASPTQFSHGAPKNFETALSVIFNVLLCASKEVNVMQTSDYFNVFLAPFMKGIDATQAKEKLRIFLLNVHQHAESTLGLTLSIPKFVADKPAIGPEGKVCGSYGDFAEESLLLALLLIEILEEESTSKPLLNPKIIIKMNNEALVDEKAREVLLKAHKIASTKGLLYFASMLQKDGKCAVFSASGISLKADLTGDWETDTLRTGCLGAVTVNMPRIAYESGKDANKFFEILKERCELAARALKIKHAALKQHGNNTLPFIMQNSNGDTYFRLENCLMLINFAGFPEAVEVFCEKDSTHEEAIKFSEEIIKSVLAFKHKFGKKYGRRLFPIVLHSPEASERLAQLDIEKYGVAKVKFSGPREKPFYTTTKRLNFAAENFPYIPTEAIEKEQKLKGFNIGGNLHVIEMADNEFSPEELMKLTEHLIKNQGLEFFTYNRISTYCDNCRKSWTGTLHKCPSCGSISTLTIFNRFASS